MEVIYRIRLLGMVQVEKEGQLLRDFESRKALALLGYLARHDQPVSRSHLAGLFWGEKEEARGRRNLSRELSQLSARLPDCFQADYYTIQFLPSAAYGVDTLTFATLVKTGGGQLQARPRTETPQPHPDGFPHHLAEGIQADLLAEAVALYRGDFMTGYFLDDCPEFEAWLVREQEGWRRQVTELLERLIAYHARQTEDDQALFFTRRWLEIEPWRERAHRYLMTLLARQGERAAALTQFETCRRVLADELAVEPAPETVALYEQIRSGKLSQRAGEPESKGETENSPVPPRLPTPPPSPAPDPLTSSVAVALHKVPTPTTAFIGREEELAKIAAYLNDPGCRLLTLIGPGGIGKTRLAIQAAWQTIPPAEDTPRFYDGVYFIPLDSLSSAEFLVPTLADALDFSFYSGTDPTRQLLNYLREKRLLLVLDNFEHLLAGTDLVAEMLRHAPGLKILTVSRERLNLQEEHLLPIQGLKVPENQRVVRSPAALQAYSAVQLFLQRAQAVNPNFTLTEADKPCIIQICRLTEGVPLAIELAAAWLRLLSCQEIAGEIEQNLDFLTTSLRNVPERQRSLRAVFDYSWRLLTEEERRVFRQLAIFRGGFQFEAARKVTGAALPLLLALVDKSLLRRAETGRYTRHLLLWQYADEKLDEIPAEKEQVQALHSSYYAAFLQQQESRLKGGQQRESLAEIGAEIENIRLAWRWAIENSQVAVIQLAVESLFHFYDMHSWFEEGAEAFALAATILAGEHPDTGFSNSPISNLQSPIVLGKLLARQGWFTFQLGQHEQAEKLLHQGLDLLRQAGPAALGETVFPLNYLGAVYRHLGHYEAAQKYLQESLAACQETGDNFGLTVALNILGQVAYLQGDYTEAQRFCQESLSLKQMLGDRRGATFSYNYLGQVAYALGEYPAAQTFFEESLAICQEIGDRRGIALCLNYLGDVVQMMGEDQGARQLYTESLAIFKEIGNQWGIISAWIKLGLAAGKLDEPVTARAYLSEALKLAQDSQAIPLVMDALVGWAALLVKEGQNEQALEILALTLSHPASSRDNQDRAARLVAELEPRLSAEAVKGRRPRSRTDTLEIITRKLLTEARLNPGS